MKVLVACEFSGRVRDAFKKRGHDATSCDFLPTESSGKHIQGDVLDVFDRRWDLMIAHPPCTYLCNSGVRWLHTRFERWEKMKDAAEFFRVLLEADIPRIAIENPVMHKYAVEIIGRRQDQIVQPWQFGHPESKATCLWLKGLPLLKPTRVMQKREQRIWKMSPGKERSKLRGLTYAGIAKAMALQWG